MAKKSKEEIRQENLQRFFNEPHKLLKEISQDREMFNRVLAEIYQDLAIRLKELGCEIPRDKAITELKRLGIGTRKCGGEPSEID